MPIVPSPGQEIASLDFASLIGGPLNAVVNAQAKAAMSTVNFIKEVGFNKNTNKQNKTESSTLEPIYVKFKFPKELEPYRPAVPPSVASVNVTNAGSGYKSAPKVTFTPTDGGSGATAVAILKDEKVDRVEVTAPGAGYKKAPKVQFETTDGGSGADATATVNPGQGAQRAVVEDMVLEVPILTMLPIPYIRVEEVTIDFNAKINSMEWAQIDSTLDITEEVSAGGSYSGFTASMKASVSSKTTTNAGIKQDRTYDMKVHVKAVQSETPAGMDRILNILEGTIRAQPANALAPIRR